MAVRETFQNYQPLTDEEKLKFDELLEKGWIDVAHAYWELCRKSNYILFVQRNRRLKIYKNDQPLTDEQRAKLKKLRKMKGMNDVALAYLKTCFKENITDEWKICLELGLIEGVGFDDVE